MTHREFAKDSTDVNHTSATAVEQGGEADIVRAANVLPPVLHLLPVAERPFFPAILLPVLIDEKPWFETVKSIGETPHKVIGLVLVKGESAVEAGPEDFYSMGTVVRMHNPVRQGGRIQFMAEGIQRFRIRNWISTEPPYFAQVGYPEPFEEDSDQVKAYGLAILNTIKELLPLNPLYGEQLQLFLVQFGPNQPQTFTDFAANLTTAAKEELQDVLETIPILSRMQKVLALLKKELDIAKLQTEIRKGVQERMTEQLKKAGVEPGKMNLTDAALEALIEGICP
jgi:ATP-dependent Lon protease